LLALSVLEWRRWNGRALLFCDRRYARYFDRIGLMSLWDAVDEETIESANSLEINPASFWSIARLLAFAAAAIPFASIDCDLIVWRSLASEFKSGEIAFTHWESTAVSPWYPRPRDLSTPVTYRVDERRDWSLRAANVSLAYFGNGEVRDTYVSEALRFTVGNTAPPRPDLGVAPELLFAEQRLLPVVAAELGVAVKPFIEATYSPELEKFETHDPRFGKWEPPRVGDQSTGITHLWMYKRSLAPGSAALLSLEAELTARLRFDHPVAAEVLSRSGII